MCVCVEFSLRKDELCRSHDKSRAVQAWLIVEVEIARNLSRQVFVLDIGPDHSTGPEEYSLFDVIVVAELSTAVSVKQAKCKTASEIRIKASERSIERL